MMNVIVRTRVLLLAGVLDASSRDVSVPVSFETPRDAYVIRSMTRRASRVGRTNRSAVPAPATHFLINLGAPRHYVKKYATTQEG